MSEQQFTEDRLVSEVYQSASHEQPPSDADREILTRALDMKRKKPSSPFAGNWKVPLSLAAVLVVGLAVVLRLGISPANHEPDADQIMSKPAAPAAVAKEKKSASRARAVGETQAEPRDIEFIEKVIESESREIEILLQKDKAEAEVQEVTEGAIQSYGSINDFMSAEFWAGEIQSLFDRGMMDQARKELIVFKEAFPEYDASALENMLYTRTETGQ